MIPIMLATLLTYDFQTYPTEGIGGGTGIVRVEFLGAAADGGQRIRATDQWYTPIAQRTIPHAPVECEIYANGTVICPGRISGPQKVLLPLLASSFATALRAGAVRYEIQYPRGVGRTYAVRLDGKPQIVDHLLRVSFQGSSMGGAASTRDRFTGSISYDPNGLPEIVELTAHEWPYDAANYSQTKLRLVHQ